MFCAQAGLELLLTECLHWFGIQTAGGRVWQSYQGMDEGLRRPMENDAAYDQGAVIEQFKELLNNASFQMTHNPDGTPVELTERKKYKWASLVCFKYLMLSRK